MKRLNPSGVAVALAAAALFVSLGGTTWASNLITGNQIENGAVTSAKIGRGQVKNVNLASGAVHTANLANGAVTGSKLASNAVTSAKVLNGSLTAADVAPNTFLQGTGSMTSVRISVPAGQSGRLLSLGFGHIDGICAAGGKPTMAYVADAAPVNLIDWATTYPSSVTVHTTNGLTSGNYFAEPNPTGGPQSVTFQAAENDGISDHVATAWTTGQDILTTSCIFTGQALTTG
jgi:hypothetical protein